VVFDEEGDEKGIIGDGKGKGHEPGQLYDPRSVACDASNRILVAEFGNQRISMFAADYTGRDGAAEFTFLSFIGAPTLYVCSAYVSAVCV
jgi:hypothetical protein